MTKDETLKLIKEFIEKRYQMVLATSGDYPWTATLYYSVDKDLKLYFLSNPKTIHCRQISLNSQVAVNISDSPQNPATKKAGIQILGIAEKISGKQKIIHALSLWKNTLNVTSSDYTYEGMMRKLIDGRMYKITPKKIKFFNEENWNEGKEPIIDL